jgi:hypothetical protein
MIKLDLGTLSEDDLKNIVFERCSKFGSISNVTIVKHDHRYNFALAAIEMSTPDETFTVLKNLGDSKVDNMVVIRIEQEEKKT